MRADDLGVESNSFAKLPSMNPFVRGSKNPFSSMKQVILEAQAVAAAAAKVADASSISLQLSIEDESQDSVHSLSPSSLPPSPSTRLNLNQTKCSNQMLKLNHNHCCKFAVGHKHHYG